MKVFLSIEEVNAAVAAYIPELGINIERKTVDVDLLDDEGILTVAVTIKPESSLPKATRKRRRTSAEMAVAREEVEDSHIDTTEEVEEEEMPNDVQQTVEDSPDTETAEDSEAPEPAASTSLFD